MCRINDQLVNAYQAISNARQILKMASLREPKEAQCQRIHDLIQRVANVTLAEASAHIELILTDIKTVRCLIESDEKQTG